MDPRHWYGLATGGVILLSMASRSHVQAKLALLLFVSWLALYAAESIFGWPGQFLVMPTVCAFLATITACLGYVNRDRTALIVFGLFGMMLVGHGIVGVTQATTNTSYFVGENLLYALQLTTVGIASAWLAVRYWIPALRQRRSHLLARG